MQSLKAPFALAALAALALAGAPAAAHDEHAHHHGGAAAKAAADKPGAVKVRGLDATLLDQDGRTVNLKRDVIGDRIVVVDFVYTTCTTVCPLASAMFADLQKRLGDDAARDVRLVSITVDPVRDTPPVLKAYARRYQAREAGWTWLTGATGAVDEVLKGMGAYSPDFTQHPLMVLVGDGRSETWTRFSGTPDPQRLAAHIERLREARAARVQAKAGQ